jgi:ADP-ribose pyrophosphatase YjhB (NUDIX family)
MATKTYPMPFTRIELCVLGIADERLAVLLGRRQEAPEKGLWALPGGVVRIDLDADLDAAAQRVATERLGSTLPYLRQQGAVGGPGRDARADWALSIVYRACLVPDGMDAAPGKRLEALRWFAADDMPTTKGIAFDHAAIVAAAAASLRREVERMDLPYSCMPPTFTLTELQRRCEQILGRTLDKSSFRRRLDERGGVAIVPGEFRGGAYRPAQLFRASS